MRFKRLFIILLIISVLCVAVACNDNSETQNPDNQDPTTQDPSVPPTTDPTPDTPSGDGSDTGDDDDSDITEEPFESDGEFYFSINSDGYSLVSAVDPELTIADIPATFNSKPVTEIADEAFHVASGLQDVNIPASVKRIGDRAFSLCRNLTTVTFGENSELYSIGDGAFRAAESLKSIALPDSVRIIGADCFNEAESLESISGETNIIRIGRDAFDNTAYIKKQYEAFGVIVIGKTAYDYAEASDSDARCIVYAGVESIADGAFEDKDTITYVEIAATVTHIGEGAFAYCDNIESIVVDAANPVYYSEDNAVLEKTDGGIRLIRGVDAIPDDVTEIAAKAFSGSAALTDADLPDGVILLGKEAFAECRNLQSVVLSEGLTRIEESVFYGDEALQSASVPAGIRDIAGTAFSDCTSLKTVIIDSPFVIEAADMSMSAGHLLQWADTVYVAEPLTDAELAAAIDKLAEERSGEELELAAEKLEEYNISLKNANSAYLAAAFKESGSSSDFPGYRLFIRNNN